MRNHSGFRRDDIISSLIKTSSTINISVKTSNFYQPRMPSEFKHIQGEIFRTEPSTRSHLAAESFV